MWDWGTEKGYLHDLITTDRRDPTRNANGPIFNFCGSPFESLANWPTTVGCANAATRRSR